MDSIRAVGDSGPSIVIPIPDVALRRIFLFLDQKSILAATRVCKKWNDLIASVLRVDRVARIEDFCQFLSCQLRDLPKLLGEDGQPLFQDLNPTYQIEKLSRMKIEIVKPESISDLEIKTLFVLKNVASVLIGLDVTVIDMLDDQSKHCPDFLKLIFVLSQLYKEMVQANQMPIQRKRDQKLSNIAQVLAKIGDVGGAITIVNLVNHQYWKSEAFFEIAKRLKKTGAVSEAIEIANKTPSKFWQSHTFIMIALQFKKTGDIEQSLEHFGAALKIADIMADDDISYYWNRFDTYKAIAKEILGAGGLEYAEKFTNTLSCEYLKSIFLCEVVRNLVEKGEVKTADQFAKRIPCRLIWLESWFIRYL